MDGEIDRRRLVDVRCGTGLASSLPPVADAHCPCPSTHAQELTNMTNNERQVVATQYKKMYGKPLMEDLKSCTY